MNSDLDIVQPDPASGLKLVEMPHYTSLITYTSNASDISNSTETYYPNVWERYTDLQALLYEFRPVVYYLRKHLPFIWILLGIPGNILSVIMWTKPRMKSSSGHYLAAGAFFDLVNQIIRLFYAINKTTYVPIYDHPGVCQISILLFTVCQYNHTILILAFTVERYIAIAYPFKRHNLCTRTKALKVIAILVLLSLCFSGIQAYFYYCDPEYVCIIRPSVMVRGLRSLWSVWTWVTELLFFGIIPIAILILNIKVIYAIRQTKDAQDLSMQYFQPGTQQNKQKIKGPNATTLTLLTLSFYTIIMELPVTVLYCIFVAFPCGDVFMTDAEVRTDSVWQSYLNYYTIRFTVENIAASHYAMGFYISLLTTRNFRHEVIKLFRRKSCCYQTTKYHNGTQSLPMESSYGGEICMK